MNGVSNINVQNSKMAFKGMNMQRVKNLIPSILDKIFNPRELSHMERMIESSRGAQTAIELNVKQDADEVCKVIKHETMRGNFDFLRSLNETLNKDLARKAYKLISKKNV